MKMIKQALAVAGVLAAVAVGAATFEWTPAPSDEAVTHYWLEHRPTATSEWVRVVVPATTNRVTIPESAFGRWFRMAAVNALGPGEYTEPARLPSKPSFRLVLELPL